MRRADAKRIAMRCGPWLLLLVACAWIYGPRLLDHAENAFGSAVLSDDMRIQLPYFYHYADKALFNHDAIGRYHAAGTGDLFRAIYSALAPIVDIVVLAKIISYVTLLLTAAGLGVAANRLGGKPAAFVAVCITLGSFEFIDRTIGGLPRAFAYPCVAWCLAALAEGRLFRFAVISVIGTGFYPLVPVIGGLTLGIVLLIMPASDRGSARNWSLRRRLILLNVMLLATSALILPFALRMRPYGSVIRAADIPAFPEAGPGGRIQGTDRAPTPPFFDLAAETSKRALGHGAEPLWPAAYQTLKTRARREVLFVVLALVTMAGVLGAGLRRSGRDFRRMAAFALAVFVGFQLAELVSPSLVPSPRYVRFGVAPLVAVVVPSAVIGLLPGRFRLKGRFRRLTKPLWVAAFGALFLALLGTQNSRTFGYDIRLHEGERGVTSAIHALPPDAVIAGWPEGFMDDLPLRTQRTAFINYQMYMPYHRAMTLEMRARTSAVLAAYYAADLAPLRRLRDQFHVTHFLLEPSRLRKRGHLFRPFDRQITAAFNELAENDQPNALDGDLGAAVVYRDKRYVLVELARL